MCIRDRALTLIDILLLIATTPCHRTTQILKRVYLLYPLKKLPCNLETQIILPITHRIIVKYADVVFLHFSLHIS